VGRDHEVIILHDQIMDRRDRQIQLQRLPLSTVVEGHIDPEFVPAYSSLFCSDPRARSARKPLRVSRDDASQVLPPS